MPKLSQRDRKRLQKACGGYPTNAASVASDELQKGGPQANIAIGSRVEVTYQGQRYLGAVTAMPWEHRPGKYAVQCDSDPEGVITYAGPDDLSLLPQVLGKGKVKATGEVGDILHRDNDDPELTWKLWLGDHSDWFPADAVEEETDFASCDDISSCDDTEGGRMLSSPDDCAGDLLDEVVCLICLESIEEDNPAADIATWDIQYHSTTSPGCGVFSQCCGTCLQDFVNKHETDPDRTGSAPCPLCSVGLREPTMENLARRTCAESMRGSERFRSDGAALLELLRPANAPHDRIATRRQLGTLTTRDQQRKTALEALPEVYRSELWYKQAWTCYETDHNSYRKVRRRYREVWPTPSQPQTGGTTAGGRAPPAAGAQYRWQAYDPAQWENA